MHVFARHDVNLLIDKESLTLQPNGLEPRTYFSWTCRITDKSGRIQNRFDTNWIIEQNGQLFECDEYPDYDPPENRHIDTSPLVHLSPASSYSSGLVDIEDDIHQLFVSAIFEHMSKVQPYTLPKVDDSELATITARKAAALTTTMSPLDDLVLDGIAIHDTAIHSAVRE